MTDCSHDGCPNPARRRGLCWSHRKQELRRPGKPLTQIIEKGKGRWEAVRRAALQYAEDTEAPVQPGEDPMVAFRRADQRLRKAVQRYFEPLRRKIEALAKETFQ